MTTSQYSSPHCIYQNICHMLFKYKRVCDPADGHMSLTKHAEDKVKERWWELCRFDQSLNFMIFITALEKKTRETPTEVKAWGFTVKYHFSQGKMPFTY